VNGRNSETSAPRPSTGSQALLNNSNELFEYPKVEFILIVMEE
jgi:hypothetical protein